MSEQIKNCIMPTPKWIDYWTNDKTVHVATDWYKYLQPKDASLTVEKAENGFLVKDAGQQWVFTNADELAQFIANRFATK